MTGKLVKAQGVNPMALAAIHQVAMPATRTLMNQKPARTEATTKPPANKPPANKPPANKPPANHTPANKPPANKLPALRPTASEVNSDAKVRAAFGSP